MRPGTLADACAAWQNGRDTGSSVLRGGARNATGIPHYFAAPYITDYESQAESESAAARSRVLLDSVYASPTSPLDHWRAPTGKPATFAGRGISSKTGHDEDGQIRRALEHGSIAMPLWGVSLDEPVARTFGERFLFVLEGSFRGVAAWRWSGLKPEEHEVITGGRYGVVEMTDLDAEAGPTTLVRLRQTSEALWSTDVQLGEPPTT